MFMKAEDLLLPDPMEIPTESIAPVITCLASLQAALAARLLVAPVRANQWDSQTDGEDELLTTADAARLLNVSEDWMYRRAGRLPFNTEAIEESPEIQQGGSAEMAGGY
jgi:hypothetical protein